MNPGRKWQLTLTTLLSLAVTLPVAAQAAKTRKKPGQPNKSTSQQIQELKDLIQAQQQQMDQQRQQMDQLKAQLQQVVETAQQSRMASQKVQDDSEHALNAANQAQKAASDVQLIADQAVAHAVEAKTSLALANTQSAEQQKRIASLEGVLGRFRFNGDIRLRGESFFQSYSGCTACFDRNRARIRVRFGFDGKLNDDFVGGVAIATGSLGDPTTTNETLTNFFDRKSIGLDRGYITYNPAAHKWLSLTGGKFPYQWQRTQVTGDPDINPEGFNEKLSFDLENTFVKNLTVQGMQVFLNENTNSSLIRAHDAFAVGGQISSRFDLGFLTTTPSVTVWNFLNADEILDASAFAVQAPTTGAGGATPAGPFPTPGEGPGCSALSGLPAFAPCAFAPNGMTNATFVGGDGGPHFTSKFLYGDVILNTQVKTGIARLPFNLLLEAEQNLRAAGHPLDNTGAVLTSVGRQSHVYLIDASLGQVRNKGDVQFGYAFLRQEQDAVLASFAESDQRAPTNIVQHRVYGLWKLRSNTVASYTLWLGRTLNPNLQHAVVAPGWTTALGPSEPILKRMQIDLIYSF